MTPIKSDNQPQDSKDLFNVGLDDDQRELLALLLEELGESQQAIGKILRHGYESRHPDGGPTNRETLNAEIGDVMAAVEMLYARGDLSLYTIFQSCADKKNRVVKYLHFADAKSSGIYNAKDVVEFLNNLHAKKLPSNRAEH